MNKTIAVLMFCSVIGTTVLLVNDLSHQKFLTDTSQEILSNVTTVTDVISTTMFAIWLLKK